MSMYKINERISKQRGEQIEGIEYGKKDKYFNIWRAIHPLSNMLSKGSDDLLRHKHITYGMKSFLESQDQDLTSFDPDQENEDILDLFHEAYKNFYDKHFEDLGKDVAEMIWVMGNPKDHHISDLWGIQKAVDFK